MSTREEYLQKMHDQLDKLNAEIDELAKKAGGLTTEVMQEYRQQMESLQAKQAVVRQKVEELQHAGGSAWNDMKSGIDLAWDALGEAIDSARSRFK